MLTKIKSEMVPLSIGTPRNYLRRGLNLKQVRSQKYDFFCIEGRKKMVIGTMTVHQIPFTVKAGES